MAEFPALPLWTDALIGDTYHLTPAEFGSYMRLLIAAWRTKDCGLPNDDGLLGRVVGDPKNWHRLKPVVLPFFTIGEDGILRQKRLSDERNYCARRAVSSSAAGRASALKRLHRGSTASQRKPNEPATPTPTPTPTSSTRGSDEQEFQAIFTLLSFDGSDHRNWLEFCAMKTRHGLDYTRHILPAAQHHAKTGKTGKSLAYIRPKAIELRDQSTQPPAPVPFENCPDWEWEGRLNYFIKYPNMPPEDQAPERWPAKWGPIFTSPTTKVPPHILEGFKKKLNGAFHDTQ